MLAVFSDTIVRVPGALTSPDTVRGSSDELVAKFQSAHSESFSMVFRGSGNMVYTHEHQDFRAPRTFAVTDDIFCIFEGALQNLPFLRQQYGLSKSVNDPLVVIEAYKALRDRAPYPPHQVVSDLEGSFVFILYDHHSQKIFVAADSFGKVPLYWGTTSDNAVAFSDEQRLIQETCGRTFTVFPQGCYFSTDEGLMSFQHPMKEVTAIPQIDNNGQTYGSTFKVDFQRTLSRSPRTSGLRPWGVV